MAGALCKEVEEEVMDKSTATSRAANRALISSSMQYLKLNFKLATEGTTSSKETKKSSKQRKKVITKQVQQSKRTKQENNCKRQKCSCPELNCIDNIVTSIC